MFMTHLELLLTLPSSLQTRQPEVTLPMLNLKSSQKGPWEQLFGSKRYGYLALTSLFLMII